ncbi:MAG: DUF1854 domain-containing protein [Phycisphaeraceae bacterium]
MKRKTSPLPAIVASVTPTDSASPKSARLRTSPPAAILASLQRRGIHVDDLAISIVSDINLLGQYATQWLMATTRELLVYAEAQQEEPLLTLELCEASEFRTVAVVGSGILQAKVGEIWLDLLRYSNRQKYYFGRTAKRLDQLRANEKITLSEEDDHDPRRCASCGLMLTFQGETCPRCINRGKAMSRIFLLLRPYWGAAIVMMLLLLTQLTLSMVNPRLTQFLIDGVLRGGTPGSAGGDAQAPRLPFAFMHGMTPTQLLLLVVGAVAGVAVTQACINIFNGRLASRVGTSITYDVRGRLVDHLQRLSLSYYDKQSTGSLVGRVAYDTEAIQGFMSQLTGGFLMQILMVILTSFFMFSISPKLALFTLVPTPFVLAGSIIYYRFVYPRYSKFWDRSNKQAGMLNGLLSGIRVVKAFNQEDRELGRFQRSSGILRDARRQVDTSAATFYPIMSLVFQMGGWVIWYVGGQDVLLHNIDPQGGMTLGKLMAYFGYMGMFYGPLSNLTNLSSWITSFSTQTHRIFEVLDTPIAISDAAKPVSAPAVNGDIEFRGVTFGYSRQTPILKNVTFQIKAGQMIGVVGRSGSGKTTIINLISRFYDVDDGQILIDGTDLRQIATGDLRRQIGVVLQEPFLFRGTIWDNMVYGRTDAHVEQVIAASRAGNSHDFIMRQMHAYDTWVGERGAGLSGGERQRLSIARALLCEPRILILDEATSSVDSESELAIQNALGELVKGRTSIIIAHRLSTLRNCDLIMVIEEGKLVEKGTHGELMTLDGKYAKLVRIQTSVTKSDSIDTITAHDEQQKKLGGAAVMPELLADPDTDLTPITGHRPRWLKPQSANIHLGNRGALHVTVMNERIYNGVFALRCRPVRFPSQYISLRWFNSESREQEIGLIRDLADWPAEAQKLVRESLLRRYFVHVISRVDSIQEFQGYLNFQVDTDLGPMQFFMRWSYDTAQDYGERGKVLLDVEENRYVIPDVAKLSLLSRKAFERYIYW